MSSSRERRSRSAELRQRAADLLLSLALVSEGSSQAWDPGHGAPGSRPPVAVARIRAAQPDQPPPKERSLHDYWAWRFDHARGDDQLFLLLLVANEDLIRAHKAPAADAELGVEREKRILAMKGAPERVAARVRINIAHVRALRAREGQDPETGDELPQDRDERVELARRMIATEGASEREAARRAGIPRSTLQRLLHDAA